MQRFGRDRLIGSVVAFNQSLLQQTNEHPRIRTNRAENGWHVIYDKAENVLGIMLSHQEYFEQIVLESLYQSKGKQEREGDGRRCI